MYVCISESVSIVLNTISADIRSVCAWEMTELATEKNDKKEKCTTKAA